MENTIFVARLNRALGTFALALGLILAVFAHPSSSEAQELRLDPALVKGPDACGECHKSSVALWKDTHHATTFKSLPRSDKAKEIAKHLDSSRALKREKLKGDLFKKVFSIFNTHII